MLRDVFFAILLRQNVARPLSATAVKRGKRVNRRRKKQNEMRSSSSCVLLIFAGPAAVAGQASSVARPGRPSQPQEGKGTGGCRLDGLDVASGTYTLQEAGSCRLRPDEAAPYIPTYTREIATVTRASARRVYDAFRDQNGLYAGHTARRTARDTETDGEEET